MNKKIISTELFKKTVKDYLSQTKILKKTADAYFADESIPLEERWEVFKLCPDTLKNHDIYIVRFDLEKQFGEIFWYDDFYTDRYATVDMVDVVEHCQDNETDDDCEKPGMAEAFKKEILKTNLGSFIMDW